MPSKGANNLVQIELDMISEGLVTLLHICLVPTPQSNARVLNSALIAAIMAAVGAVVGLQCFT